MVEAEERRRRLRLWLDEVDFNCGCGDPYAALAFIHDVLRLTPHFDHQEALHELMPNVGNFWFVLYWLDQHGLTEHGTTISGAWLTDGGKALLEALDAERGEGVEEPFELLFDGTSGSRDGYCIHGYDTNCLEHECLEAGDPAPSGFPNRP